ncbi:MAG: poly(A) polymerase [Planctomycetota bacterium]|jgi:poly(A) polymerase
MREYADDPDYVDAPHHDDDDGIDCRTTQANDIDPKVLDRDAKRIVMRLQNHGYEAYFVGGCVRDLMIGRVPKDFDVATSAHPNEIRRLFRNGRIIGRRFRLVHIYYGDNIVETSTFRSEPSSNGKQDDDSTELLIVEDNEFGTAREDAYRRDFTVNGLFLDPATHEIHDYVDGLRDLERRVLRTIGDPDVRMAEDPVRIMRAVKFATRLDLRIEDQTWDAMCSLAPHLEKSAPPRVLEEILRLMRSRSALGAFRMLRACGAMEVLLPALDDYLGPRKDPGPEASARAELMWRLLEALDSEVAVGYMPSTAVCIAVIFLPIVERECEPETRSLPGDPGELSTVAWEVIEPMAIATRLSRREFARARRIISIQHRFLNNAANKRFSPILFARSEDFPEALELFKLRVHARGQGSDLVEGWEHRRLQALEVDENTLDDERRKIRKRRKRRRRTKK